MKPRVISPSYIVRKGLGLPAEGLPLKEAATCCMCGIHLEVDALANIASISTSFTDDAEMAQRGGTRICADCTSVMGPEGLRLSGYGTFSEEGMMPFRKWADVAHALLNPPEPPFVMTYAVSKSQHMAWRSPVNWSRDAFFVRVGARSLLINRQNLLKAPAVCARVANAIFGEKKKKAGKTLPNPFVSLAPDMKDMAHGKIMPKAYELLKADPQPYPSYADDVQWLCSLTVGDVWALRFILTDMGDKNDSPADEADPLSSPNDLPLKASAAGQSTFDF